MPPPQIPAPAEAGDSGSLFLPLITSLLHQHLQEQRISLAKAESSACIREARGEGLAVIPHGSTQTEQQTAPTRGVAESTRDTHTLRQGPEKRAALLRKACSNNNPPQAPPAKRLKINFSNPSQNELILSSSETRCPLMTQRVKPGAKPKGSERETRSSWGTTQTPLAAWGSGARAGLRAAGCHGAPATPKPSGEAAPHPGAPPRRPRAQRFGDGRRSPEPGEARVGWKEAAPAWQTMGRGSRGRLGGVGAYLGLPLAAGGPAAALAGGMRGGAAARCGAPEPRRGPRCPRAKRASGRTGRRAAGAG